MTGRWEYLNLSWAYVANDVNPYSPPGEPAWSFEEEFYVRRPGADAPEEIFVGKSDDAPHFSQILNELGAEGWELVGFEVTSSRVGKYSGWIEAGCPVARNWTLKRPIG